MNTLKSAKGMPSKAEPISSPAPRSKTTSPVLFRSLVPPARTKKAISDIISTLPNETYRKVLQEIVDFIVKAREDDAQLLTGLENDITTANTVWTTSADQLSRSLAADLEGFLVVERPVPDPDLPSHVASVVVRQFLDVCNSSGYLTLADREKALVAIIHGFSSNHVTKFTDDMKTATKLRRQKLIGLKRTYLDSSKKKTDADDEKLLELLKKLVVPIEGEEVHSSSNSGGYPLDFDDLVDSDMAELEREATAEEDPPTSGKSHVFDTDLHVPSSAPVYGELWERMAFRSRLLGMRTILMYSFAVGGQRLDWFYSSQCP
ncbi:hypothetical protein VTL71DRAFT_9867 [Oculimacula yallundae]|uniref:Uncharacterized protein n=1 Tax=Oculimacula yallundae TaxID=86028 RepID=A0ABR4BQW6_9HELO